MSIARNCLPALVLCFLTAVASAEEVRWKLVWEDSFTLNLGQKTNPVSSGTAKLNPGEFNTFGLEWFPDKLVFTINGEQSMTYPKITTDKPGQWPFDQPFYLLIDMQLGGKWVGAIDESQLPVQMEIDWVKVFERQR
jgi:beta-glucanase (GH16 family)